VAGRLKTEKGDLGKLFEYVRRASLHFCVYFALGGALGVDFCFLSFLLPYLMGKALHEALFDFTTSRVGVLEGKVGEREIHTKKYFITRLPQEVIPKIVFCLYFRRPTAAYL
jgi:hypothetical protein